MYDELIKWLRFCATEGICAKCDFEQDGFCSDNLMKQAADVIEILQTLSDEQSRIIAEMGAKYQEAAAAIEELSAVCKKQEIKLVELTGEVASKPKWIPVTERLPEDEKTVLTWGKENQCILLDWMHDNKWCCFGGADYWMPLPEPPEKESES